MDKNPNIIKLYKALADFYNIPIKHGWKTILFKNISDVIDIKNADLLSTWVIRGHIPDLNLEKILDLNVPENIRKLCKECKKPVKQKPKISDPLNKYDLHGGWKPRLMGKGWELMGKTAEILSSNTSYRIALASNINAFYHAIQTEQDLRDTKTKLENTNKKLNELESRIKVIEKAEAEKKAAADKLKKMQGT